MDRSRVVEIEEEEEEEDSLSIPNAELPTIFLH